MPRFFVRIKGLILFLVSLYFYTTLHESWLIFFLLWLVPDVSLLAYLKNPRVGATIYNTVHNYILAFAIVFAGIVVESTFVTSLGAILGSHVALDRALGFGLKYPNDAFHDTHIQKV